MKRVTQRFLRKFLRFLMLLMTKKIFTYLLFLLTLPLSVHAQDDWNVEMDNPLQEPKVIKLHDAPEISSKLFTKAIPTLNTNYTGYAIELIASKNRLERRNPNLKNYGKIYCTHIEDYFQYHILLDFNSKKSIKKYFRTNIKPHHPEAKVVRFLNGVRTTILKW